MGCADCCAKTIIIIINIFFFLLGLAFLAGGIVYFVGRDVIGSFLENAFENVVAASNTTDGAALSVTESAAEFLDIFQPLFIALLVLGIIMIISSILAMCGSCCSVNCMLITYVVIVLVIFCAHVALFICLMVGAFSGNIKESLQKSIDNHFVGIEDQGPYSLGWNIIMLEYQCCGIESYKDFEGAKEWNRYPKDSNRLETPVACCQTSDGEAAEDYDCAYYPTDENSNWKTGCWGVLNEELVTSNKNIVIGVNCAILGFELILAALTLCVIFQARKER